MEEMQSLGLFGIYAESCKIIFTCKKIFTKITLSSILPLSFFFLTHEDFLRIIFTHYLHLSLFKPLFFASILVFSLLSTSAVVCTVASRVTTFNKVMSVVPRLMVTSLCTFLGFLIYNISFGVVLFWWVFEVGYDSVVERVVFWVIFASYFIGFIYMTIIWQLASVVTVLEDSYGISAMIRGMKLIKGRVMVALVIFSKLIFLVVTIYGYFRLIVVNRWGQNGVLKSMGFGVVFLVLLMVVILFALVVQTVIYFVCKSNHREKSVLSDHLEDCLGEYEALKGKDIQVEVCCV